MHKKYLLSLATLSFVGMANAAHAARDDASGKMSNSDRVAREDKSRRDLDANRMRARDEGNFEAFCAPEPPATCYPDDCVRCTCLGPDTYGANAPVCPKTCKGDFIVDVAALYWIAHEDGLEYAIINDITVAVPTMPAIITFPLSSLVLNQLVDADFLTPHFRWNFGFEAGLGYCSPCDGWDFELIWTWYKGKAHDYVEADIDSNTAFINLWSAYSPPIAGITFSRNIETNWNLKLNLVDLELGRHFWTSRYLSIRPFVGVRYASVRQDYYIQSAGGSFSAIVMSISGPGFAAQIDHTNIKNYFNGAGVRGGLDSYWNVGCGWAIYGNFAASIIYGRFFTEVKEDLIQATTTTTGFFVAAAAGTKTKVVNRLFDRFRASRGILDLALGIQWATMFCDCQYGFTVALGWEQHLFFDQNQFWSIERINDVGLAAGALIPNLTGENVYTHRRGDLDTAGLTLSIKFEF